MLMPSIFGDSLFEDFMDFPFRRHASSNVMKTDVKDAGDHYELDIDMPGFDKKDIKAELKDGYMTISATTDKNNDEKDKDGKYIRRERYYGSCSRSFYVGENVEESDITNLGENGILKLSVPKCEDKRRQSK
ncbi:MAG: Hsp20/alpha crystallin family protein [[Clostridium] scindens]